MVTGTACWNSKYDLVSIRPWQRQQIQKNAKECPQNE